jgi:hypothetical protein
MLLHSRLAAYPRVTQPPIMKTVPALPKPNTTIWRYLSLHAFLSLMADRSLMFRQFKELQKNDTREGMVTEGFWESVLEFYRGQDPCADLAELRKRAEESLNRLRCFEYASCWNMAKTENALMWKAYASRGVAIKTTVSKLTHAQQQSRIDKLSIRVQKIEYANHWRELEKRGYRHDGIALNRLFLHTKRRAFIGEKEVRFRIQPVFPFKVNPDGSYSADPKECPPWFPLTFENLDWIEEVVAESSIPPWAVRTIRQLIGQHNLHFRQSGI